MRHNAKQTVDGPMIGPLHIGGCDVRSLARKFGTPLLILDEATLRAAMRRFRSAFSRTGWSAGVTYAGKALLLGAIARIAHEEGLAVDVCSRGELETALRAGVPADRLIVHGCFKTDDELDLAVEKRVRHVVVDHRREIEQLDERARARGSVCEVLVRVNPGISAHTHEYVRTGAADSKFGFPIADGQALEAVTAVAANPALRFAGVHCHIGSQILDLEAYAGEVDALAAFAEQLARERGISCSVFDVGGGLGIDDEDGGPAPTPEAWANAIFEAFERRMPHLRGTRPALLVEPGRALVAPAGTTLYRIGVRKRLPDGAQALIVDGGMSDNPRPALYEASYPVTLAARPDAAATGRFTIFGRHCETDRLFRDVPLPDPQAGDLLAVGNTGAYTYSMASNYNRFPRPAVVLVKEGSARVIARREPLDRVLDLDVLDDAPAKIPSA